MPRAQSVLEIKTATPGRDRESRGLSLQLCELKFAGAGDASAPTTFEGYASKWGGTDWYGDTMVKGAFMKSLGKRMPLMLNQHRSFAPIGKWVEAKEDDNGLRVKGELTPGHSEAADVGASLKHGALSGLSIGGYTVASEPGPQDSRLIKEFDLWEISPVTMPADESARVDLSTVKSLIDECHSPADFEHLLREAAGLSKSAATAFVARLRKTLRGEPESEHVTEKQAEELARFLNGFELPNLTAGR